MVAGRRQQPTATPHRPPTHHRTHPRTRALDRPRLHRLPAQQSTAAHPAQHPNHHRTHAWGGPHPHPPPTHHPLHPQIRAHGGRLPHPARRQQPTATPLPHPPPTHHPPHPQTRADGGPHPRPAPQQQPTHPSPSQRWAAMHSARRQPTTTRLPQAASPPHHRTHAQSGAHGQPHGRSVAQPLRRAQPAWGDAPPTHAPVPILIPTRIHRRARVREP